MPRDRRAVIGTAIWNESSIRKLKWAEQMAYFLVYTQADLNKCGVIPYRPGRWAKFSADQNERQLRRLYAALNASRHVVLDEGYDELLVRTYVGHDGLLAQPLVVVAAVREYQTVSSPLVRLEILRELRRVWTLDKTTTADRRGIALILGADPAALGIAAGKDGMQQRIRDGLGAGLRQEVTDAIDKGLLDPWPDGYDEALADLLAEGLGKGSGQRVWQRDSARSPAPAPAPTPTPSPQNPSLGLDHASNASQRANRLWTTGPVTP
jgi:hypothetical protein